MSTSRALTALVGVVATILIGWVLHVAAGILQPLVIALFLCSMLQPVVRWLAQRHIPPPVTVIALVTLLFLGFARTGVWVRNQVLDFVGEPVPTVPLESEEASDLELSVPEGDGGVPAGGAEEGLGEAGAPATAEGDAEVAAADGQEKAESEPLSTEPATEPTTEPATGPATVATEALTDAASELASGEDLAAAAEDPEEAAGDPGEASEEPEPVRLGLAGIRTNLEAKLRESNLPEAVTEFTITSMRQINGSKLANDILGTGLGFFTGLLLVVIYMLFIFAEQAIFRRKILAVTSRPDDAASTLDAISRGIQRYLSVKTVVSLATGVLCYSVLEGLRVPYAPFFGFLTFLLNFIPTFGSIAAGALATVTAFASKGSWESAVVVASTYMAVNLSLGSYIEPRILGRELNLSPLVILISVVVWAGLWGVAGTFLAVPLTATIQIVLANNETTRPIAILFSSGPPREDKKRLLRKPSKVPKAS